MRTPSLMSAKSLAHLHAAVVVEELRRCGVGVFCLSPGARAIPLVLALEEQQAVVTKLFNDERSAAFWAQGAAKGGVLPCLICTSGTAAANYLPAVVEASLAGTPMLVLTTDRPFELHYAKANQTLPQRDLFSPFAQGPFDIPAPEQRLFLHALLANLDQAVFEMRRTARPVHLNLAYRKPFVEEAFTVTTLPPAEVDELARWSARDTPYCTYLSRSFASRCLTPSAWSSASPQRMTLCVWLAHWHRPVRQRQSVRSRLDLVPHCWPTSTLGCAVTGTRRQCWRSTICTCGRRSRGSHRPIWCSTLAIALCPNPCGVSRRAQDGVHPVLPLSPAAGCYRERVHVPDDESLGRSRCLCCRPGSGPPGTTAHSTRTRPGNLRVGSAATAVHPPGRVCYWGAG